MFSADQNPFSKKQSKQLKSLFPVSKAENSLNTIWSVSYKMGCTHAILNRTFFSLSKCLENVYLPKVSMWVFIPSLVVVANMWAQLEYPAVGEQLTV